MCVGLWVEGEGDGEEVGYVVLGGRGGVLLNRLGVVAVDRIYKSSLIVCVAYHVMGGDGW